MKKIRKLKHFLTFVCCLITTCDYSFALPSTQIAKDLVKLGKTGKILYLAAHPDDENTKVISFLSNFHNLKVGYLSLTRGSGGQNLIGEEQFPVLGFIRTEELLGARKIDGGEQFFTRALDFGYSKTAEETLSIWPRDEILSDIVYVIRKFRPDIIITRFAPDTEGHGHHKASAILAKEAFFKAASPNEFPEQLKSGAVDIWQAKKLYHNKPHWLQEDYSKDSSLVQLNVGSYDFSLGRSNTEIAAASRTMHKSQGFGSKGELGDLLEYFEPVVIKTGDQTDLFAGLDFSLESLGFGLSDLHQKIVENFDFRNPAASVPSLLELRRVFTEIKDGKVKEEKLADLDKIISECLGVKARVEAEKAEFELHEKIQISLRIYNPSDTTISIEQFTYNGNKFDLSSNLKMNEKMEIKKTISADSLSIPFWLRKSNSIGSYNVNEIRKRVVPSDDLLRSGTVTIAVGGQKITFPIEAGSYSVDPIRGEVRSYLSVLSKNYQKNTEEVEVVGEGNIQANNDDSAGKLGLVSLDYAHFPKSKILTPYKTYNLKLPPLKNSKKIAYIQGSGDRNPEVLQKMGFLVDEISKQKLISPNFELNSYDALILGIRALNVIPEIGQFKDDFLRFMKNGGVIIVQYSTANRISKIESEIWPYDIKVGSLRVTDEKATPGFLEPKHLVFSSYYKITKSDFEDWVQERGLYFASSWDDRYVAPLSFADPGEPELAGSLLITSVGKGYFVYTGLSFFRQLPAGVTGAAKLFTNLLFLAEPES